MENKDTHRELRKKASKRYDKKPKAHVRGFTYYEKQRPTVYSLLKLYHAFKQDHNMTRDENGTSGYTLDDSPKLWWMYWKDMHENVLKGRLERMQRCFLDRFPMRNEDGEVEDVEELLRDTEKFNKYLNRVIEGTPENDFNDSLLPTSKDKRDDQGNSMIRDLILQNMCLHFEVAEADHECLEIAEDWFEWEKSVWNSSSEDEDLTKKLSHVALLKKMISKNDEEKLFSSSATSNHIKKTSNDTKKTSNETTTTKTKKCHSSLNILCRDLLKELMKVHTKGEVDPKLWKEYGGGEVWTESLRDFSLKQHISMFRAMHESGSSRSREKLLERCGDSGNNSLLTHQSIEELNTLWQRAKILANKTYASASLPVESNHKLVEIVEKDVIRAQYLRDVHHEHSTVSKVAEMYLSYATMTLDGVNKMSELRRAEKKTKEDARHNVQEGDYTDDDDNVDENEVFDVDAMSKTYRFSEETIRKYVVCVRA